MNRDGSLLWLSISPSSLLPLMWLKLSSFELYGVSFSDASTSEFVEIETLKIDGDGFFFFVLLSATFLIWVFHCFLVS